MIPRLAQSPGRLVAALAALAMFVLPLVARAGHHDAPSRRSKKKDKSDASATGDSPSARSANSAVEALHPLTLLEVRAIELPPRAAASQEIRSLYEAAEKLDNANPDKASKLYDLARLHAESERFYRLESRTLSERLRELTASGSADANEVAALRAEQQEAQDRQQQWLQSATEKYELLAGNPAFARYRRMDQALVALITLYMFQGREEKARPLVKRLLDDFPTTLSMPDAYLAFAEFFFDKGDWEKAVSFYDRMMKYPESPRFNYATYKESFCYLELKNYQKAMQDLTALIKRGRQALQEAASTSAESDLPVVDDHKGPAPLIKGSAPAKRSAAAQEELEDPAHKSAARLAAEARRAVVWTYAQVGAADKAWPFFVSLGKAEAPRMMENLAGDYLAAGKPELSTVIWQQLAHAVPDSTKVCDWLAQGVKLARAREGTLGSPEAWRALAELIKLVDTLESPDKIAEEQSKRCVDVRTALVRVLVLHWDQEMSGADDKTLHEALPLFEKYREEASGSERYDLDYQWAQIQAKAGKACEAASLFLDVYRHDPSDAGAHRTEAAKETLAAWHKCLGSNPAAAQKAAVSTELVKDAVDVYGHGGGTGGGAAAFFKSLEAPQLEAQFKEKYGGKGGKDAGHHHHH